MKIVREGKEIELTEDELYRAYCEKQHEFDYENVRSNMDGYLAQEDYEVLKDNTDFIEDAAYELRINIDKYDMSYEYAIKDAIETIKRRDMYEM